MNESQSDTQTLYVRDIPKELIAQVDAFAEETKGATAKYGSRSAAIVLLLQRALAKAESDKKRPR